LNCILWENIAGGQINQDTQISSDSAVLIHNSIVQGWTGSLGGVGNNGLDPLFVDADGPDNIAGTEDDDCRLMANSPARNTGDNSFLPLDTFDLDDDGDTKELLPLDLDGLPRIAEATVDRGPYEYHPAPGSCPADIAPAGPANHDGVVGPADLAQLLSMWGACPAPCAADLNPPGAPNGQVGPGDLAQLLSAWGQCP
jgi:hypothetical protein